MSHLFQWKFVQRLFVTYEYRDDLSTVYTTTTCSSCSDSRHCTLYITKPVDTESIRLRYHYFAPGSREKYCDEYVCLSVCQSARVTPKFSQPNFTELFVHVVLSVAEAWSSCDGVLMLCTSGFTDDVMFSYDGSNGPAWSTTLYLEEFARWQYQLDVR